MKKTTEWPQFAEDVAAELAAGRISWDMAAAFIAKRFGLGAVKTFLTHFGGEETCEVFEDAARELRKCNLGHVGDVLLEFAEVLRSSVEAEINRERPEYYDDKAWAGKRRWYVSEWLRRRMRVTGQSWNELVRRHDLEEWADLIEPDVLCQDGRWYVVGPNGQLIGASRVPNAPFVTRQSVPPTRN
jgi:hypothetical protein